MKLRWKLLLTIAVGLLVGPLIKDIPGFVVIALGNYTVQTRLWQAIVVIIILLLFFILIYHLIARLWNSAGRVRNWSGDRHWKKSRLLTINGMIALAEADWSKAEKLLVSAAQNTDTPLIVFLAAAQAAQAQKADARRDNYLRQAHLAQPNAEIAIGLTQAQLQLNHGQYEQALATLTHLKNLAPKHDHVLLLLQKLYRRLGDWQGFIDIAPQLQKSISLSPTELEKHLWVAWQSLLSRHATRGGIEALHTLWFSIPKSERKRVELISCYAQLLIVHGAHLEAEKILRAGINKHKDNRLLYLYGKVVADDLDKQSIFFEKLANKFVGNATWHLTSGRLFIHKKLWGKAKIQFQQSLDLLASPETYLELARALEALGEKDAAIKCYRNGLAHAIEKPASSNELVAPPVAH